MQQLPKDTLLQGGKYKIEKVLGQGGFGITYLATQELLDRKVCIKEFFFKEYCERDEATSHVTLGTQSNHEFVERFMTKFLKEARTISQLNHPNIIRIHDIFKENNTAYYVMEYIEGESLNDKVNQSGALPESEAVEYIKQVASALDFIHQRSINHLDVKPANIMVCRSDNKAILIDFGLSKQYDEYGGQTSTTPVGISHGYAPMEQYKQGGVSTFSPQTDIYALGATLYKLVTGNTPPQAMDILDEGLPSFPTSVSSSVIETIKKAMQPRKVDRQNSIDDFLKLLNLSFQNICFIKDEAKLKNNLIVDEETKILNDGKVRTEELEESTFRHTQSVSKDSTNNVNKKGNKFSLGWLIISLFILTFFLCLWDNSNNHTEYLVHNQVKKETSLSKDEIESLPFNSLSSLAHDGNVYAQYKMGKVYWTEGKYSYAFQWYEKAAQGGYAESQYELGYCYHNGFGVKKDYNKAKEWYEKAANQGHKEAQNKLKIYFND